MMLINTKWEHAWVLIKKKIELVESLNSRLDPRESLN